MELQKRKPTRIKGYDYSSPGVYFVTICTKDRKMLLSRIVGEGLCALPKIELTNIGNEIEKSIKHLNNDYDNVNIEKYTIMPNHLHLLVMINESGGHGNPPLQDIIRRLKSYTTKLYGNILWQRSFHDHIIRDEKDYKKIWEYIDTNAANWEKDCFYND